MSKFNVHFVGFQQQFKIHFIASPTIWNINICPCSKPTDILSCKGYKVITNESQWMAQSENLLIFLNQQTVIVICRRWRPAWFRKSSAWKCYFVMWQCMVFSFSLFCCVVACCVPWLISMFVFLWEKHFMSKRVSEIVCERRKCLVDSVWPGRSWHWVMILYLCVDMWPVGSKRTCCRKTLFWDIGQ